ISNIRHDYVRPYISPIQKANLNNINDLFQEMEIKGKIILTSEGVKEKDVEFIWTMDMRYIGQIYEVETPISRGPLSDENIQEIENLFNKKHEMIYGYSDKNSDIEIVHLRVKAVGKREKLDFKEMNISTEKLSNEALKEVRRAYFDEEGDFLDTNVYNSEFLLPGNVIEGPAIIEEPDTTIVIIPNSKCIMDKYNNYLIKLNKIGKSGDLV
ncbi:unnamed protein product, partial [marine sediment metagenome]